MEGKELKLWARSHSQKRWQILKYFLMILAIIIATLGTLMVLFYFLLTLKPANTIGLLDLFIVIVMLLAYLFSAGLLVQFNCILKNIVNDNNVSLKLLKVNPLVYLKNGLAGGIYILTVIMGCLLFVAPGILVFLKFMPVMYLLANNQDMKITQAVKISWKMMNLDQMAELFLLILSFVGWFVLGLLTLLIGYIWILPYFLLTISKFLVELENSYLGIKDSNQDIDEFVAMNHLQNDGKFIYGWFNEYPIVIEVNDDKLLAQISVSDFKQRKIDEFLTQIELSFQNVKTIDYHHGIISLVLSGHDLNFIYQVLKNITLTIRKFGFLPGCHNCHRDKNATFYRYQNNVIYLCDDCHDELEDHFHFDFSKYLSGFTGSLIGALIGALLWIGIYQFTSLARVCGYLIALFALIGYQKITKETSVLGLVTSIVISLIVFILSEFLGISLQVLLTSNLSSLLEAMMKTPEYILNSGILYLVEKDILIGLSFMLFAYLQFSFRLLQIKKDNQLLELEVYE